MPPQLGGIPLGGAPLGGTQGEAGTPSTTQNIVCTGIASTFVCPGPTLRLLWHHMGTSSPPEVRYRYPNHIRARGIDPTSRVGTPTVTATYDIEVLGIGSDGKLGMAKMHINTERIDEEALLQLLIA